MLVCDRAAIADPDWSSSESMLRVGGPYRCGIMIEHNWRPRPGLGSCIFLHVWDSARRGTAGCTAVSSAHLEQLLHWLDAQKNPLIVQLPLPEYFLLRRFWELPSLTGSTNSPTARSTQSKRACCFCRQTWLRAALI